MRHAKNGLAAKFTIFIFTRPFGVCVERGASCSFYSGVSLQQAKCRMGLFCVLRHNRYFEGRKGSDNSTTGLAGRVGGLPMTIRGGGDPLLDNGLHAAVKDGPTAPELAADAHDCIMVRS